MQLFILSYFFIIGLIFGSFFNVVGLRVPQKKLFEKQRSYCPHCKNSLNWYELIPVLSFLVQNGKCRHCKRPIAGIYPTIELATAILFAFSYYHLGIQLELLTSLLLISLLIIITVSDLTYMAIPNRILLFFLPLFILARIMVPLDPWWSPLLGAVIGYGLIAVIILVSRGGMGGGDMKLFAVIGVALGYKQVLLAFFLSTLFGSIISILLIGLKWIERKKPIPFGPFIVLGTLTTFFFGDNIMHWYLTTFF